MRHGIRQSRSTGLERRKGLYDSRKTNGVPETYTTNKADFTRKGLKNLPKYHESKIEFIVEESPRKENEIHFIFIGSESRDK